MQKSVVTYTEVYNLVQGTNLLNKSSKVQIYACHQTKFKKRGNKFIYEPNEELFEDFAGRTDCDKQLLCKKCGVAKGGLISVLGYTK